MKYACINRRRDRYLVRLMCRLPPDVPLAEGSYQRLLRLADTAGEFPHEV